MKKNVCPFLPARLIKGKDRWFIGFYQTDPVSGKRVRIKQTFDLNRIPNHNHRSALGQQLEDRINQLLPFGYPFLIDFDGKSLKKGRGAEAVPKHLLADLQIGEDLLPMTNIVEALRVAEKIKCQTDREQSIRSVVSTVKLFVEYLENKGLSDLAIGHFSHREAMKYMDYWILERKVNVNTYNTKLNKIKAVFSALVERDYLPENPFKRIKRKPKAPKRRRNFTKEERDKMVAYIKENDFWLYVAVRLMFYCFIRPAEMRRLRFKHFDFSLGVIHLPADITKNRKQDKVTMPVFLMKELMSEERFIRHPANYLVFGNNFEPHPSKPCGERSLNYKHHDILKNVLGYTDGLSLYSWKDTGMTDLSKLIRPSELKEQGRHSDFSITENYLHDSDVLEGVRKLEKVI